MKNLKFENSLNFELKNCRILNRYQKVDPTAGNNISNGAFRIIP